MAQTVSETHPVAEVKEPETISGGHLVAKALKAEKVTGSVELGKSADLIVLNHNLFKSPIHEVGKTQVQMTFFEGKVAYQQGK